MFLELQLRGFLVIEVRKKREAVKEGKKSADVSGLIT